MTHVKITAFIYSYSASKAVPAPCYGLHLETTGVAHGTVGCTAVAVTAVAVTCIYMSASVLKWQFAQNYFCGNLKILCVSDRQEQ